MTDLTKVQFVYDAAGEITYALVPFDTYVELAGEENVYEDIEHPEGGIADDVRIPNAVVNIMSSDNCSLMQAWRKYRGYELRDVIVTLVDMDYVTFTSYETKTAPVPEPVLAALAVFYNCTVEQLKD